MNRRMKVNLAALVENYLFIKNRVEPARCAAVLKANAYGLGVGPVSRALVAAACDAFFVATVEEAVELRASITTDADIFVLEGVSDRTVADVKAANVVPVMNSLKQVRLWASERLPRRCILHIDTGMSRLGLNASDVEWLATKPALIGSLNIDYIMTHLACADTPEHQYNAEQLARFSALTTLLPPHRTSISNTAGIFLGKQFHGDLVRAGIGLYGGNPHPGKDNPMLEVVQVQGRVLQVWTVDLLSGVGYGATVKVGPPTRLATIAFGYADGYPRSLGSCASAMIGSYSAAVLGRISMDTLVLDVSGIPTDEVEEGTWATLLGGGVDLDGLAAKAGTISYDLLSGIGRRVARQYT